MKVTLTVKFPPMDVRRISRRLRRTADEPFTVDAAFDDGRTLAFTNGDLAATDVHAVHWPLEWLVDACEGNASDGQNAMVTIHLDEEPVRVYPLKGYSLALECPASATLILADGMVLTGKGKLPECRVPFGGKAEAVTMTIEVST